MPSDKTERTRRLESLQEAFLSGEITYNAAVEKLCSTRLYYSIKGAKDKVDSWSKMEKPVFADDNKKLPEINQPLP